MAKGNSGRIPDGAMVGKVAINEGDKHEVGTIGRVAAYLGETINPFTRKKVHGYKVQWQGHDNETVIYDDGRLALLRTTN